MAERNHNWNELYKHTQVTDMPWYNPDLDADLSSALDRLDIKTGSFLDVGTGPATQAMHLKNRGFEVTGTDLSQKAIALALEKYPGISFLHDDILKTSLSGKFDYIFDRGCFHVIDPGKREIYVRNIHRLLNDAGILFLKCFSNSVPDNGNGPYRFSEAMIRETFEGYFRMEEIHETEFQILTESRIIHAKFAIMRRKKINGFA